MWASFFRSRNHTLHLPFYLRICVGVSLCFRCLWALFFRTRNIACLFVYLCWPLKCACLLCICVGRLSVWGFRYVCGRLFLERGIFTHLFRLFIFVKLIISVHGCFTAVRVHGCFTAVTVRHEPSRIVAVRTNLATRLGSSRSADFFRGRCTLPEVHFRYPFSRHDFRCDGRDSR